MAESLGEAARDRLDIYRDRLEDYVTNFQRKERRTKLCCGVALVLWALIALSTATFLFLALYYLPKQALTTQNMIQEYSFVFQGGSLPQGSSCSSIKCSSSYVCGNVTTTNWQMPEWDAESWVDDVLLEVSYSKVGGDRIFLTIESNNVLWRQIELPSTPCGDCQSQVELVHAAFHNVTGYAHKIWRWGNENNITLSAGEFVCFTAAKMTLRYSKDYLPNYLLLTNSLYWAGLAAAGLTALLPAAFCGHMMQTKDQERLWLEEKLARAQRAEQERQTEKHRKKKRRREEETTQIF